MNLKSFFRGILIFCVILAICSILGCTGSSTPEYVYDDHEMLENGSIELVDTTMWNSLSHIGMTCQVTTAAAASPSHSLLIDAPTAIPGAPGDSGCYWQQIVTSIPVGKQLKLQVKIKTVSIGGDGLAIVIRCDDATTPTGAPEMFVTTQGKVTIKGTIDWTTYQVEMTDKVRTDMKSVTVYLIALPGTTGTAYFDDVSLIH